MTYRVGRNLIFEDFLSFTFKVSSCKLYYINSKSLASLFFLMSPPQSHLLAKVLYCVLLRKVENDCISFVDLFGQQHPPGLS